MQRQIPRDAEEDDAVSDELSSDVHRRQGSYNEAIVRDHNHTHPNRKTNDSRVGLDEGYSRLAIVRCTILEKKICIYQRNEQIYLLNQMPYLPNQCSRDVNVLLLLKQ